MKLLATGQKSLLFVFGVCSALVSGCGQDLEVGSDILWTSRFEGGNFDEWKPVAPDPQPPNTIEVSNERSHGGSNFAAKLTVSGTTNNTAGNGASLVRVGNLPTEAYYSAWYYLPQSISVGVYWVIMKFRYHTVANDATTDAELFDVNLKKLQSGEMSLRVYDHRSSDLPLSVKDPKVSVGKEWFQIEAFYRNAPDSTGRLTLWLDGQQILDWKGSTGSDAWIAWDVVSVGNGLSPEPAILYVDDCAISKTRVGFTGLLSE